MSIEVIGVIGSIVTAGATLGAVGVALWLGITQQRANTKAIHDSQSPFLSPKEPLFFRGVISVDADQKVTATDESGDFNFAAPQSAFLLKNVGPAVALNVDGVIMGPVASLSQLQATNYRLKLDMPLPSGSEQLVYADQRELMVNKTDEIITGWTLGAPAAPSANRKLGETAIVLRLTITCSDVFNRVHAFVYDYSENHTWLFRDWQVVKQSIEDRNRIALNLPAPKPLPAPQYIQVPRDSD